MSVQNTSSRICRGFQEKFRSCKPRPKVTGKAIIERETMLTQLVSSRVSQIATWPAFADHESSAIETLSLSSPPNAQGGNAR